jgi:hypothetical protein
MACRNDQRRLHGHRRCAAAELAGGSVETARPDSTKTVSALRHDDGPTTLATLDSRTPHIVDPDSASWRALFPVRRVIQRKSFGP